MFEWRIVRGSVGLFGKLCLRCCGDAVERSEGRDELVDLAFSVLGRWSYEIKGTDFSGFFFWGAKNSWFSSYW
jgi:hypothetical protein